MYWTLAVVSSNCLRYVLIECSTRESGKLKQSIDPRQHCHTWPSNVKCIPTECGWTPSHAFCSSASCLPSIRYSLSILAAERPRQRQGIGSLHFLSFLSLCLGHLHSNAPQTTEYYLKTGISIGLSSAPWTMSAEMNC